MCTGALQFLFNLCDTRVKHGVHELGLLFGERLVLHVLVRELWTVVLTDAIVKLGRHGSRHALLLTRDFYIFASWVLKLDNV
jgi:hypothetical protein